MKSTNTLPERLISAALEDLGYLHERNVAGLPGTPDIVLRNDRVAVFVHGCFWHRHHLCSRAKVPTKDTSTWLNRFASIVTRDQQVVLLLSDDGWFPRIVWECEILADQAGVARRVVDSIDAWHAWNRSLGQSLPEPY